MSKLYQVKVGPSTTYGCVKDKHQDLSLIKAQDHYCVSMTECNIDIISYSLIWTTLLQAFNAHVIMKEELVKGLNTILICNEPWIAD